MYQPGYPPPQYQAGYPIARPTNGLALAALICGCLQFVTGVSFIPAIICGHIARSQIRRSGGQQQGAGMALAGLILGYVGMVFMIVAIIFIVVVYQKVSHLHCYVNSAGRAVCH